MKQTKVGAYRPNYPKKALQGAALAAAALLAVGGTGCRLLTSGMAQVPVTSEPAPTDELVLDGEVGIEVPTEEPMLEGEPAVEETDDAYEGEGEPALMGKIVVPEDTPEP